MMADTVPPPVIVAPAENSTVSFGPGGLAGGLPVATFSQLPAVSKLVVPALPVQLRVRPLLPGWRMA